MIKLILMGAAIAVGLALFLRFRAQIVNFFFDVNREMAKVSWPTYSELKQSTTVVIILSLIFVVYIFIADTLLTQILQRIF